MTGPDQQERRYDLGTMLRGLRRVADLSQRQLAQRSGVPASTIGRLEASGGSDARFTTVLRLVRAAGGTVQVIDAQGRPVEEIPHEDLRNEGGRHYPAHVDVRRVVTDADWWACWWAGAYSVDRALWGDKAPLHSFDLSRPLRDYRRENPPDGGSRPR